MSLANVPPHPFYAAATSFDPFGSNPDADVPTGPSTHDQGIIAPQGRAPVAPSSLVPSQGSSRPASRPDFIRGFGLDIPEEEEEDACEHDAEDHLAHDNAGVSQESMDLDEVEERDEELLALEGTVTAYQSRLHSRHVSKLSAALSIRSAGALGDDAFDRDEDVGPSVNVVDRVEGAGQEDMDLEDVIGEWTGSEDVYPDETSEEVGKVSQLKYLCY